MRRMSAAQVTGKSRRRDSGGDATEQYRTGRKRAQNRVSQQCARERKRLAERRKVATLAPSSEPAQQRAYLELVEENEQLTEALLSTRRKLLSLSTAAASAAEHPIFQRLLALSARSPDTTAADEEAVLPSPASQGALLDLDQQAGSSHRNISTAHQPVSDSVVVLPCSNGQRVPDDISGMGLDEAFLGEDGVVDMLLNSSVDYTDFDHAFAAAEWPMASCPNDVVERLEETMLLYLAHRFGMQDISRAAGQTSAEVATQVRLIKTTLANANFPQLHLVLDEAATVCVELMTEWSCLTSYIFGVGAHVPMEHLMRWRLAPSSTNEACIPAPFCPTPLQYTVTDHPIIIDFVNWPTIRDQLILHRGKYDLDSMISDVVYGTVIDVPAVGCAFNVRDLFLTRVESGTLTGDFDIPAAPTANAKGGTARPKSRTELVSQVAAAMRKESVKNTAQSEQPWKAHIKPGARVVVPRTHAISQYYGLDDLSQWRLSGKFAAKYPFLDCSEVMAVYPLRSALLSPLASSRLRSSQV